MSTKPLDGKTALVTGASRGIGAASALLLSQLGARVVVNYRSRAPRAEKIVAQITEAGGEAFAVQADVTDPAAVAAMFAEVEKRWQKLDFLFLNASGGMEKDVAEDYALRLNRDAQVATLNAARPVMSAGSRVIFVTSHQAHFVATTPTLPEYLPVAESKRAGEDAIRALIPELSEEGIDVVVVSGDMIVGTATAMLLNRINPGVLEARESEVGKLYTVEEFAAEVVEAATAPIPDDHIRLVGDVSSFTR